MDIFLYGYTSNFMSHRRGYRVISVIFQLLSILIFLLVGYANNTPPNSCS